MKGHDRKNVLQPADFFLPLGTDRSPGWNMQFQKVRQGKRRMPMYYTLRQHGV